VGPVYYGGDQGEAEKLASCHRESIRLADEQGLQSIAFPAISTGVFGYPVAQAAAVAVSSTVDALGSAHRVKTVRFVLFDAGTLREYERAAEDFLCSHPSPPFRIEKASS
jgi:O-acetyl-ADP-ribose deacetylase (regulator of RNase III)